MVMMPTLRLLWWASCTSPVKGLWSLQGMMMRRLLLVLLPVPLVPVSVQ